MFIINKKISKNISIVLLIICFVFPLIGQAFTTDSTGFSNNHTGAGMTLSAQTSNIKILDFNLPTPGGDSNIAGTAPVAGTAITTTKDADWTTLYFHDAAGGADWAVANDIIFVNDGNIYYDNTKDTKLAGATTENALGVASAEATDWIALSFIDAVGGGAWSAVADTIFEDKDGDDKYGPESTPADVVLAGVTPGATTTHTGVGVRDSDWTTVYTFDASDSGVWDVANDIIFVDDGNIYYDNTKDTKLAGATTENALGSATEPANWTLFFYDKTTGGAWDSSNDWIGKDADSSGYYQGDKLISVQIQSAGTYSASSVRLWVEDGTNSGFQASQDTQIGSAEGLNSTITVSPDPGIYTAGSLDRIYVTVDVPGNAPFASTIRGRIPVNGIDLLYATDGPSDTSFAGVSLSVMIASRILDSSAPNSVITAPFNGENISQGIDYVISGRSTDTGGSSVRIVQVSLDNGISWRQATSLQSSDSGFTWQYIWENPVKGNYTIKAFAKDWIGNIERIPAEVNIAVSAVEEAPEEAIVEEEEITEEETVPVEAETTAPAEKEAVVVAEKSALEITIDEIKTKIEQTQLKIIEPISQLIELLSAM